MYSSGPMLYAITGSPPGPIATSLNETDSSVTGWMCAAVAGSTFSSPTWLRVSLHVPPARPLSLPAAAVHIDGVSEVTPTPYPAEEVGT